MKQEVLNDTPENNSLFNRNLNNPNLNGKINYIDLMDDAEKEHIRSELNTHLTPSERRRKIVKRPIGDYFYVAKIKDLIIITL